MSYKQVTNTKKYEDKMDLTTSKTCMVCDKSFVYNSKVKSAPLVCPFCAKEKALRVKTLSEYRDSINTTFYPTYYSVISSGCTVEIMGPFELSKVAKLTYCKHIGMNHFFEAEGIELSSLSPKELGKYKSDKLEWKELKDG